MAYINSFVNEMTKKIAEKRGKKVDEYLIEIGVTKENAKDFHIKQEISILGTKILVFRKVGELNFNLLTE